MNRKDITATNFNLDLLRPLIVDQHNLRRLSQGTSRMLAAHIASFSGLNQGGANQNWAAQTSQNRGSGSNRSRSSSRGRGKGRGNSAPPQTQQQTQPQPNRASSAPPKTNAQRGNKRR